MLAGTARTSVQALALVTAPPDVLLLDLGRSPVRGLEMVRAGEGAPDGPAVVAMTLFHTPGSRSRARRAGADALVGKESFRQGTEPGARATVPHRGLA